MEGLRKPGRIWAEVGAEDDPGSMWTLRSFRMSHSIKIEEFKEEGVKKRKWKNRSTKNSSDLTLYKYRRQLGKM